MEPNYNFIAQLATDGFLTPAVLLSSVCLSYFGIVRTIKSNRNNVKDRATITYIMERNKDERFSEGMWTILSLDKDDHIDLRKFAKSDHRRTDEATKIRYVANHYEYLSVGVLNNIYNEDMLINASRTTTIKIHHALENYIEEIRKDRKTNTIYEHFDTLAKRWTARVPPSPPWYSKLPFLKG